MKAIAASKAYSDQLTDFEKGEILGYQMIYYIGERQNKILGSCVEEFNNGFDDENGDYKIIIGDQIGF